ncbi:MAG: sulfite exporter TauE/SafE family protein [Clostridia bacterium]|nr:sulfite exporter TauE/SafE family protein [Clostridia bacterium]
MLSQISKSRRFPRALTLAATGALAGLINGMLGTGGGIISVFALTKIYAASAKYSTKDIFAMTYASSAVMSVAAAVMYLARGSFALSDAAPFILPSVVGGIAGAILLDHVKADVFRKLFALLVIWAGLSMMAK